MTTSSTCETTEAPDWRRLHNRHTGAIGQDVVVSADVLYVRGKHQLGQIDYNPRIPAFGTPTR